MKLLFKYKPVKGKMNEYYCEALLDPEGEQRDDTMRSKLSQLQKEVKEISVMGHASNWVQAEDPLDSKGGPLFSFSAPSDYVLPLSQKFRDAEVDQNLTSKEMDERIDNLIELVKKEKKIHEYSERISKYFDVAYEQVRKVTAVESVTAGSINNEYMVILSLRDKEEKNKQLQSFIMKITEIDRIVEAALKTVSDLPLGFYEREKIVPTKIVLTGNAGKKFKLFTDLKQQTESLLKEAPEELNRIQSMSGPSV